MKYKTKLYFEKLHCRIWAAVQMVNAYLAWHRGEKVVAADFENDANRYVNQLRKLELLG